MERKRQYMAYFLVAVSILVLMVSVFPHHHHGGRFCIASHCELCLEEGCPCQHHSAETDDCEHSCSSSCITRLLYLTPDCADDGFSDTVLYTIILPLLSEWGWLMPSETLSHSETYYLERLHALRLTASVGLRAPPFMVLS